MGRLVSAALVSVCAVCAVVVAFAALALSAPEAAASEACPQGCPSSCALSQLREGACDERGECAVLPARACPSGFACGSETACATTCNADGECASGYVCADDHTCASVALECTDGHLLGRAAGTTPPLDCAPYACLSGASRCNERCAGDNDCASPNVCGGLGRCVPPPPDTSSTDAADAGAQSCAVVSASGVGSGTGGERPWLLALFVLATIALSSLRRRRASRPRASSCARSLPRPRCR